MARRKTKKRAVFINDIETLEKLYVPAKKKTYKELYASEIKRIKRQIKDLEKRGYYVSKSILPEKPPKRIRKESVEALKKKDLEYIYSRMRYFNRETGEDISGLERRKQERREKAKKGAETRKRNRNKYNQNEPDYTPTDSATEFSFSQATIQYFRNLVSDICLPAVASIINSFVDSLIVQYGQEDVAQMLKDASSEKSIPERLYEISNSNEKLKDFLNELIDYLPDVGDFQKDEMKEQIEELMYEDEAWEYYTQ